MRYGTSDRDGAAYLEPTPRPPSLCAYTCSWKRPVARWYTLGSMSLGRQEIVSLPVLEFVRRWTTHILPKGFTKSRCYGGWSNTRRKEYQQQSKAIRPTPDPAVAETLIPAPESPVVAEADVPTCPRWETLMTLVSQRHHPSWRDVFYGLAQPLPSAAPMSPWQGSG